MKPKAINIVMTNFQDTEDKFLAFNFQCCDNNTLQSIFFQYYNFRTRGEI